MANAQNNNSGYNKDLDVLLYEKVIYQNVNGKGYATVLAARIYSYDGAAPKLSFVRFSALESEIGEESKRRMLSGSRFSLEDMRAISEAMPKLLQKLEKYATKVAAGKGTLVWLLSPVLV